VAVVSDRMRVDQSLQSLLGHRRSTLCEDFVAGLPWLHRRANDILQTVGLDETELKTSGRRGLVGFEDVWGFERKMKGKSENSEQVEETTRLDSDLLRIKQGV